jgi:ribosomal protein L20
MVRVKRGNVARKRRKKILQLAKGYRGAHSRLFRVANQQVMKALRYSYVGRKQKKRVFRKLWISRINASARQKDITYSQLISSFKQSKINLNRKMLAQMAVLDCSSFYKLIDLEKLLNNLPFFIYQHLYNSSNKEKLIEIVLDLGRRPEARFTTGPEYLSQKVISWQDIDYITKRISKFSGENRAGIERTLHRISCIRNRQFLINGLTCRVGRAVFGTISIIRDLLESGKSILILGKPGVGKTTIIREIARVLSDEMEKRVIIIDTSNEIAGDSDVPHSGIGRARRMQVPKTELQYKIMLEAIENHMPQVIVIDEIGTELEALATRTIAEKGVQLVGTTHGNCLENLIKNPSLSDLIGGIQYVTISDEEAKRRGTQKSILERKSYPAFQLAIEVNNAYSWTIHENVENSVDLILRKDYNISQIRNKKKNEKLLINYKKLQKDFLIKNSRFLNKEMISIHRNWFEMDKPKSLGSLTLKNTTLIIYPYSLSKNLIREILTRLGDKIIITTQIKQANLIIGLKKHLRQNFRLKNLANKRNIPIYTINQRSIYQIMRLLQFFIS